MERQVIQPKALPQPSYPFSLGIRLGNLLFTSGATGRDADGKTPSDIRDQTRNTLEFLRTVLAAAGTGFEHVLKTTVYMTDINKFEEMNDVYRSYFPVNPPARSTVGVAALALPGLQIEIEIVAQIPGGVDP
jgi:2-iminobutanoate/2-iminopropanoate deaminase